MTSDLQSFKKNKASYQVLFGVVAGFILSIGILFNTKNLAIACGSFTSAVTLFGMCFATPIYITFKYQENTEVININSDINNDLFSKTSFVSVNPSDSKSISYFNENNELQVINLNETTKIKYIKDIETKIILNKKDNYNFFNFKIGTTIETTEIHYVE